MLCHRVMSQTCRFVSPHQESMSWYNTILPFCLQSRIEIIESSWILSSEMKQAQGDISRSMDASSPSQSNSLNVPNINVANLRERNPHTSFDIGRHRCINVSWSTWLNNNNILHVWQTHEICSCAKKIPPFIWVCNMHRVPWFVRQCARLWSKWDARIHFLELSKRFLYAVAFYNPWSTRKDIFWDVCTERKEIGMRDDARLLDFESVACIDFYLSNHRQCAVLSSRSFIGGSHAQSLVYPYDTRVARFYCLHLEKRYLFCRHAALDRLH